MNTARLHLLPLRPVSSDGRKDFDRESASSIEREERRVFYPKITLYEVLCTSRIVAILNLSLQSASGGKNVLRHWQQSLSIGPSVGVSVGLSRFRGVISGRTW